MFCWTGSSETIERQPPHFPTPTTSTSTRRFCARPSSVLLSAIGLASPAPRRPNGPRRLLFHRDVGREIPGEVHPIAHLDLARLDLLEDLWIENAPTVLPSARPCEGDGGDARVERLDGCRHGPLDDRVPAGALAVSRDLLRFQHVDGL